MILGLIIALFTLIIALICFYPLLCQNFNAKQIQRNELNKVLYFQRVVEIEREHTQGLLDNLEQAKLDLQKSLLNDIPAVPMLTMDKSAVKNEGKLWFVSGLLSLFIIAGATYFSVGSWQFEQMLNNTYQKLSYFQQRAKEENDKPLSDQEMDQFAMALRQHLQKFPKDAHSWWQLGQIAMSNNKSQLAFDSYQKANDLAPDNIEYKLSYARILMFSEAQDDKAKGESLLKEVILQDHGNLDALGLLAFYYFELENYKMAVATWGMMLKLLPENDNRRKLIERSMNVAITMEQTSKSE